ncbi:MAG: AMP-binding protein, partial [bacterium]|nr:AMP-binding protein [bacterium]
TKLINLYGPTEATVDVSYYNCSPLAETAGIPIGKPIDNIKLYILDRSQRVQPVGIPGELYISGDGLARGYLNRPQLTADSFVDNPFFPGEKMYRTGDLALWSENGNIEFLGRLDFQVKIRGFRIELGEIENHLMAIRGVKDAAVLASADRDGDKFLCAYIATEEELSINAVRDHLSTVLLDYMVPSFFILLDTLPLTPNGKLDRKALPAPGTNENDNEYAAPAGTVEKKLAEIWANVLKVDIDKIGRDTGFFKLGGHSLKANSLVSQIHREFDIKIPLPRLLNKPTIKNLAKYMKEAEKETYSRIQPTEKKDHYPLSSAQQRLYVQQQMDESNTNYNIPQVLDMDMDIHPPQLEEMFQRIIRRHESFRTYFNSLDHRVVQRIAPGVPFKMEYHVQGDGCDTDINQPYVLEVFTNFVRAFDLTVPPLLRVGLIKINARRHLLMLDMHHIIADGVSIEVLTEELAAMYLDSELPPLSIQYKDFASWQNSLFTSGKIKEQEDYWLHQFADLPSPLDLPSDKTRPRVKNFTGDSLEFTVDKDLTEQLKQVAEATDTTLFMVMLTVFYIVLFKYTRREDIVLGTPVTGRRHDDLHRLIGMVTNMLAVRAKPAPGTTFMEFLRQVREVILEAFENQDFQFNDLVKKLGLRVELDRNPLFDVVFAMQIQGEDDKLNQGLAKRDDVKISSYTAGQEKAQFDLILNGTESADGIALNLVYSTELFHRSTAEKMTTHYLEFLKQAVQNSEKVLKDFEISHRLTAVNTDMLLEDNNDFGF